MKELLLFWAVAILAHVHRAVAQGCGNDVSDCIRCDAGFTGFSTQPGKCGCCAWPCNCKCIPPKCPTLPPKECGCVEMAFIVDASGSIGQLAWAITTLTMVDFINVVDDCQPECPNAIKVAPITFGTNATMHWDLQDPQNADTPTIIANLQGIPRAGGVTNIVEAIELALTHTFMFDDPECIDVAIVISDGKSTYRNAEIPWAGAQIQGATDIIYCIKQTTNVDHVALNTICGDPGLVVDILSFQIITNSICEALKESVAQTTLPPCLEEEECYCCCTTEQFWGGSSNGFYV